MCIRDRLDTAEISAIFASVDLAMILANVVFPEPGGPQSIMENSLPCDTILYIMLFLQTRWFWPMNPFMVTGRIRSDNGGRFVLNNDAVFSINGNLSRQMDFTKVFPWTRIHDVWSFDIR